MIFYHEVTEVPWIVDMRQLDTFTFDVLLAVRLSIILVINQLYAQNLVL